MKPNETDMTPELLERFRIFRQRMIAAGLRFGLSCVIRLPIEQDAFWLQGRAELAEVNAAREKAGMSAIAQAQNVIVTHTKLSKHFPDKLGKARAFDIMILRGDNKPTWDLKFDGQGDGVPDYLQAAQIGKECGLEPGAFWNGFRDYPHYQLPAVVLAGVRG